MGAPGIVEAEVTADRGAGVGDGVVGFEVDFLIFHWVPSWKWWK
jgi:hypothetical protein